jgi:DNA-damage-inducible protein D
VQNTAKNNDRSRGNKMNDIVKYSQQNFDGIKHINENGQEYWYARELQAALEYAQWRRFAETIERAKIACENSGNTVSDHFADVGKMVALGSGAEREVDDIMLSRYACYLIVMNGDSRKEVIALGQTYFAVKTRQQEIIEDYDELSEEQKRIAIRAEMKAHNKSLAAAAEKSGVKTALEYSTFQNRGYQGLYGGLTAANIKQRKGLKGSQQILDHMGSTELAANLFRATQTDEKLRRENIQGKENAGAVHYAVGVKVRQTIAELGGTMPENLPTPSKSVKQLEREQAKSLGKKNNILPALHALDYTPKYGQ